MLSLLHWLFHQIVRLWWWLRAWLRSRSTRTGMFRRGRPAARPRPGYRPPKPKWVRTEIIRLKALMPEAGCRTIAHHFNRRFLQRRHMTVGKTYVATTLCRHQHLVQEARRKLKHRIPRPLPRNLIWGCDLMVKRDRQGRAHLVLAILDHASRACLRLQRLHDKSALTLLRHLVETCRQYKTPRWLRTDNEAIFASRRFRLALRLLGIRPQRTDPGCPWQNGRVERFIGTVKERLALGPLADGEALDRALPQVRGWYNHGRPHDHLGGRTPAEVWAGVDVFAPPWLRPARLPLRLARISGDTG